jgi:hypothetical protein
MEERTERSYQLDDFDEHPVVRGGGQEMEELGCENQIVLWISTS